MVTIQNILQDWTDKHKILLVQNYDRKNIRASGNFERSIRSETTETSTQISGAMYIGAAVYGRKPTSASGPGVLRGLIRQWIDDKGIVPYDNISKDSLAFLITRHIHKFGIKIPNQYGNDGRLLQDTFTPQSITELQKEISRFYVTNIVSDIQKSWQ